MKPTRKLNAIGYAWLAQQYPFDPIPHFIESFTAEPGIRLTIATTNRPFYRTFGEGWKR